MAKPAVARSESVWSAFAPREFRALRRDSHRLHSRAKAGEPARSRTENQQIKSLREREIRSSQVVIRRTNRRLLLSERCAGYGTSATRFAMLAHVRGEPVATRAASRKPAKKTR